MGALRFLVLLKKQREASLQTVLRGEHVKIKQFFMGAWVHFTTIHKEKCELLSLTRDELNRTRLRR
jgi:hypothetical protein